ncbi:MAG: recombinase family protein, partial [Clostridia bacterium]|nr:recombinase family protein [Clostridia bacterium]MDY5554527.1 recombinase family protein [Blautia sp.]
EAELNNTNVSIQDWEEIRTEIPTWQQVFLNADPESKRVLVTKLVDRIEITKSQVNVRFKININDFFTLPRISGDHGVPE